MSAKEISPRPLEDILGMPVKSCLQADVKVGNAAYRYIRDTGFTRSHEYLHLLHVTSVKFSFEQQGLKRTISIPLLTLVPMPLLQIEKANLSFIANIGYDSDGKTVATYGNKTGNGWGYNEQTRYAGQMGVKIVMERYNPTIGISKILGLAVNNSPQLEPFSPSNYQKIAPEKIAGICNIVNSLKCNLNNSICNVVASVEKDINKWTGISDMFRRYLELRKLPVEERAKLPYKTIVRDGHIIYTDCCNYDGKYTQIDLSNFTTTEPEGFTDIYDEEDEIAATGVNLDIKSLTLFFEQAEISCQENAVNTINEIAKELNLKTSKDYTFSGKTFSLYIPDHKCFIDCIDTLKYEEDASYKTEAREKYRLCTEKGYSLLTFENWQAMQNIRLTKDIIAARLKLCTKKYLADQCRVCRIFEEDARLFLNAYHPQAMPAMGEDKSRHIFLGLGKDEKLLEVMVLSKMDEHGNYEITRVATRHMCYVVGGLTCLLRHFFQLYTWNSITAYADLDTSNGNTCKLLGFKQVSETIEEGQYSACGTLRFILHSADELIDNLGSHVEDIKEDPVQVIAQKAVTDIFTNFKRATVSPTTVNGFSFYISEPKHKLLVECYTNDKRKAMPDKYTAAKNGGYSVLFLDSAFIIGHRTFAQDMIAAKIKACTIRYVAKKCSCKQIASTTANNFYSLYNPTGTVEADQHWGIYAGTKLVEVMSFKKTDQKNNYEIVGLCTQSMVYVVGGVSKLLSHFQRCSNWNSLTVYTNNEISDGKTFEILKFKCIAVYNAAESNSLCGTRKFVISKNPTGGQTGTGNGNNHENNTTNDTTSKPGSEERPVTSPDVSSMPICKIWDGISINGLLRSITRDRIDLL